MSAAYERMETVYEGAFGQPFAEWCKRMEADGWELTASKVKGDKRIKCWLRRLAK